MRLLEFPAHPTKLAITYKILRLEKFHHTYDGARNHQAFTPYEDDDQTARILCALVVLYVILSEHRTILVVMESQTRRCIGGCVDNMLAVRGHLLFFCKKSFDISIMLTQKMKIQ